MNVQSISARLTRPQIQQKLASLINEIAKIPSESILETATIDGELSMDSVVFIELQVAIEEEFQIDIDPIHTVELNEFGAIVDYVYDCVAKAAA